MAGGKGKGKGKGAGELFGEAQEMEQEAAEQAESMPASYVLTIDEQALVRMMNRPLEPPGHCIHCGRSDLTAPERRVTLAEAYYAKAMYERREKLAEVLNQAKKHDNMEVVDVIKDVLRMLEDPRIRSVLHGAPTSRVAE